MVMGVTAEFKRELFLLTGINGLEELTMMQIFEVKGMTCGHCEKAVNGAVLQVDPAAEVKIDRANNSVAVTSDAPREAIAKAISEEGYAVSAI